MAQTCRQELGNWRFHFLEHPQSEVTVHFASTRLPLNGSGGLLDTFGFSQSFCFLEALSKDFKASLGCVHVGGRWLWVVPWFNVNSFSLCSCAERATVTLPCSFAIGWFTQSLPHNVKHLQSVLRMQPARGGERLYESGSIHILQFPWLWGLGTVLPCLRDCCSLHLPHFNTRFIGLGRGRHIHTVISQTPPHMREFTLRINDLHLPR